MKKHGVELPVEPSLRGRRRLARRLRAAVEKTVATVPGVVAVLTGDGDGERRLVTVLSHRSDEAIMDVAGQELALMRELGGVGFDFWTAPEAHLRSYLDAGYSVVFEKRGHGNTRPT